MRAKFASLFKGRFSLEDETPYIRVFALFTKMCFGSNRSVCIIIVVRYFHMSHFGWLQVLSQDLETGCLKLAIVKNLGVQIFNGDHNILRFQP